MPKYSNANIFTLKKSLTGIAGLDDITGGGLPTGRPTLVCGSAGCGKTLFAMEFLVHGIVEFDEPGVFMAFEETREELTQNVASLGFDLPDLIAENRLTIDHVSIDRADIDQTGEYDLDGLFVRLAHSIKKVNAKRVVLDTIEVLFAELGDTATLRTEIRRLFRWLKDQGVTTIITGERGAGALTRHGIEEYVSDCVILLDHRVENQLSVRRLRIVKYRGTAHGTDEYPFLIDEDGFSVLPITSVGLEYDVSYERIPTGIPRMDELLGGEGYYRGSTVLISGPSGTGKTTISSSFVDAACQRGERCIVFSFEESAGQMIRNMKSIGLDLKRWVDAGLLRFENVRPTYYSLEMHLTRIYKVINDFDPQVVVMDPVSSFHVIGSTVDSRALVTRLIDLLKQRGVTAMLTSLTAAGDALEQSEINISSMVDTWLLVSNVEANGERNRLLYVLKSRGMAHSNQINEFEITSKGVSLMDAYLGNAGVLTGSARLAQELQERYLEEENRQTIMLKQLQLERNRAAVQAQIDALQAQLEIEQAETQLLLDQENRRKLSSQNNIAAMSRKRRSHPKDDPLQTDTDEDDKADDE